MTATPRWGSLRCAAVALPLALLALPAAAKGEEGEPSVAASEPAAGETTTRWAHPQSRAPIRHRPNPNSRKIARVHYLTEDGFPEVYLVVRRWTASDGRRWLKVRVPMRPNGKTGWVKAAALGRLRTVTTRLVVDRRRRVATLTRSGRRIWRSRIGVGAPGTPTPAGRFWIRERIRVRPAGGIYGPWAFGTSAYSSLSDWPAGGVIGIHGTNQPELIPGRPSHGCIRVPNRKIKKLARRMPIGTPVRIR